MQDNIVPLDSAYGLTVATVGELSCVEAKPSTVNMPALIIHKHIHTTMGGCCRGVHCLARGLCWSWDSTVQPFGHPLAAGQLNHSW